MLRKAIDRVRTFNRFYTNLIGLLERRVYDSPFSLTQARVFYELNHHHGCTARDIMGHITIDEGYLSRILDGFIKLGLVRKSRSAEDGRAFRLTVTPKGRAQFQRMDASSAEGIGALIGHLGDRELDELMGMMERIERLLKRSNEKNIT